jgi:hypothetical protein
MKELKKSTVEKTTVNKGGDEITQELAVAVKTVHKGKWEYLKWSNCCT